MFQSMPIGNYVFATKVNHDGTLGIDYYRLEGDKLIPVTNTEFRQATGMNTDLLERGNFSEYSSFLNATRRTPQATAEDVRTGGGYYAPAPAEPVFQPMWFEGQWYQDPQALAQAMLESGTSKAQEKESAVEKAYRENVADIERVRQRLLEELPEARREAFTTLRGYYHALSPDVYQSRQAVAEQETEGKIKRMEEERLSALEKAVREAKRSLEEAQRGIKDWLEGWREQAMSYASAGWREGQPLPQLQVPEVKYQRANYSIDIPALLEQVRRAPGSRVYSGNKAISEATKKRQTKSKVNNSALERFLYSSI